MEGDIQEINNCNNVHYDAKKKSKCIENTFNWHWESTEIHNHRCWFQGESSRRENNTTMKKTFNNEKDI